MLSSLGCEQSDEFVAGSTTDNYKCVKCNDHMGGCIKCSSATVCLQCTTGMSISSDTHSCEFICSAGYLAATLDSCVTNCWDSFWLIGPEGHNCVAACGVNQWEDTTSHECKYCSAAGGMMNYCIRCDGANSC